MEKSQLRILLVEDSVDDAELLVRLIKKGGYSVYYERIDTAKQMVEALTNKQWDVIISDYKMPGFSGIKALEIMNEFDMDIPFILVSGTIGEQLAVEAMRKGANDYLMKENLSRLVPAIERELKESKIRNNERKVQKEVIRLNRIYSVLSDINEMIVRTQDKQEIFEKACKIAVDKGQFVLAWIGLLTEDEESLKPIAFAGLKDFRLLFSKATSGDTNWSESFTFNTLKSGETKVFNDIQKYRELDKWKEYLNKTGLTSMAIVPLKTKRKIIGAYFLHSNEINFFNEGEIKLLEELADDISFAIESIEREAKRKEIEKALIESENKFKSIFNNAAVGIDLMDKDYNFIELNDKLSEILGYKKSELIGKSILEVTYPDDFEITKNNLKALVNGNIDSYLIEKRYKKKDGSIFWGELFVSGIRKENKDFQSIVGVIVDINKRKQAEELLKKNEEKYREIVENANSIIAKFDKDGRILSMNEFGLKLFEYTEKELVGKTWSETILPKVESTGKILETLATDIVKDVDKYSVNLNENVKKNGERIWVYWTNKPIRDKDGQITGILSVGTDVTDKMMAEKQMEKNVEYFAHLVDHIRNPLAILSGFIQVKVHNEETRARLMRQVDRIEDMIKQLDTGWMDTEETRKFLKKNR